MNFRSEAATETQSDDNRVDIDIRRDGAVNRHIGIDVDIFRVDIEEPVIAHVEIDTGLDGKSEAVVIIDRRQGTAARQALVEEVGEVHACTGVGAERHRD